MAIGSALVIVALTSLAALYVAAEIGAVGVRRSRLRQLAEDGHWLARRLLPLIGEPRALTRYISASQIGITLTSLVLGAYAQEAITPGLAPLFMQWFGALPETAQNVAELSVLLVLTIFNIIMGELVPKFVALQYPTQIALYTLPLMLGSLWLFRGFISILNGSTVLLLKLLGMRAGAPRHVHSPDELEMLIAESRDGGLLEPDEHRRLQRALRLRLRTTRQLMVPRERIQAVDANEPFEAVVKRLAESPFTRIPVYRGTLDRLIGSVNTKQLALRLLTGGPLRSLADLLRPSVTVPDSLPGDRLLTFFRERRAHQAVVLDPTGRVAGIVSLEDVLQDLLGSSRDEAPPAAAAARA
jgi:CBS domain containing-hemolysin-like protein